MDLKKLKKEQLRLAKKVITTDRFKKIRLIGGCDQAFTRKFKNKFSGVNKAFHTLLTIKNKVFSCIVVLDYRTLSLIEKKFSMIKTKFQYIPGFLSYREVPAIVKTYKKLKNKPDILLCDFNGILHPRRIGAASHMGVLLGIPTIGIAKNLLCGKIKGDYVYFDNEKRAYILKRKNYAPLYISPGHNISLETSIKIIKKLLKNKLPEPIRLAHHYVNSYAKNFKSPI